MFMVFKKIHAFFAVIIVFAFAVSLVAFNMRYIGLFDLVIRLLALNGFIALSIAAICRHFSRKLLFTSKNPS